MGFYVQELLSFEGIEFIIEFGNRSNVKRDIDLIVVGDIFENMIMTKRKSYVNSRVYSTLRLDLLCFTIEEYLTIVQSDNFIKLLIESGTLHYGKRFAD